MRGCVVSPSGGLSFCVSQIADVLDSADRSPTAADLTSDLQFNCWVVSPREPRVSEAATPLRIAQVAFVHVSLLGCTVDNGIQAPSVRPHVAFIRFSLDEPHERRRMS